MSQALPIYLDNNATTRVDPRVLEDMLPYFSEHYGNSGSKTHAYGWAAQEAVEKARRQLADCLGARPAEIFFTSGATESNNMVLLGGAQSQTSKGKHIVSCTTEHKAVLDPLSVLTKSGFEVSYIQADSNGRVSLEQVQSVCRPDTILISLMTANNELGTIHPIEEIGEFAQEQKILFHSDAAQAIGKIPVNVKKLGVDLLSLSAHKFYGPKGVGALYIRGRKPKSILKPIVHGGGQEMGLRPGTTNVALNVALGSAASLIGDSLADEMVRIRALKERLKDSLLSQLEGAHVNSHSEHCLPGTLSIGFEGIESEALLMKLPMLALSSGSACTSDSIEASYVLKAIGLKKEIAHGTIRFGIGRFNQSDDIDRAAEEVSRAVKELRG